MGLYGAQGSGKWMIGQACKRREEAHLGRMEGLENLRQGDGTEDHDNDPRVKC